LSLEELQRRVQYLEDLEAIKQLKYSYAKVIEEKASVFTEDGVWNCGEELGLHQGSEEIRRAALQTRERADWIVQHFVQPTIEIESDGKHARGQWYMWCVDRMKGGKARWASAIEDEKYEKVNGKWLIAELKIHDLRTGEMLEDDLPSLL